MKFILLISSLLAICLTSTNSVAETSSARVYWEDDNGQVIFYADNPRIIEQWAVISLSKIKNITVSQRAPLNFTLQPNSKRIRLFELNAGKAGAYNFNVATLIMPGKDPTKIRHNDLHLYQLPFAHGQKYKVGQGYFGAATHVSPNAYAVDFNMDLATPVHAARSGIVMEVKQDSDIGGPDPRYSEHANHVVIYHQDGTFANYGHLKQNGALVRLGDRITAGQKIGLSGNTGQSSGPHLHFEVFKYNSQGQTRNLPVTFLNHDKTRLTQLKSGLFYYARDPALPDYPIILGRDLTNNDFTNSTDKQSNTDKLEIVERIIDDSIALFAKNGKTSAMALEIRLDLSNYSPSQRQPITSSVAALSEQFLVLLQPIDPTRGGSYGYSLTSSVTGREINDQEYQQQRTPVAQSNKVLVTTKEIDNKVLLYASNGYNTTIELTLKLTLLNMTASKKRELTVSIAPLSRIYLQHLRPKSALKKSQFTYSYSWQ
jgi:hypothetical protein